MTSMKNNPFVLHPWLIFSMILDSKASVSVGHRLNFIRCSRYRSSRHVQSQWAAEIGVKAIQNCRGKNMSKQKQRTMQTSVRKSDVNSAKHAEFYCGNGKFMLPVVTTVTLQAPEGESLAGGGTPAAATTAGDVPGFYALVPHRLR
jgi:hypothetical protein